MIGRAGRGGGAVAAHFEVPLLQQKERVGARPPTSRSPPVCAAPPPPRPPPPSQRRGRARLLLRYYPRGRRASKQSLRTHHPRH